MVIEGNFNDEGKMLAAIEKHAACTLAANEACIMAHFFSISRCPLPLVPTELGIHGIWQRNLFIQT